MMQMNGNSSVGYLNCYDEWKKESGRCHIIQMN